MNKLNRAATLEITQETLCADFACEKSQLSGEGTYVVIAREIEGRRRFPYRANILKITTLGRGAVITCSPNRLEWAQAELGKLDRETLFSPATLSLINRFVAKEGQFLEGPDLKFLCAPDTFRPYPAPTGVELELVATREGIASLYIYKGFNNALGHRLDSPRPDVLAAVARQAGQVIGIAGVSADNDKLWQIGIDVLEPYQGRGIGKALVSAATEASMAQGKIPYYSTSLTNLRSSSIASGLGYWLAWLEAYTRELK